MCLGIYDLFKSSGFQFIFKRKCSRASKSFRCVFTKLIQTLLSSYVGSRIYVFVATHYNKQSSCYVRSYLNLAFAVYFMYFSCV